MVAFNFKSMHVERILSGEKCATIRPTARCKPGDKLQLYTGMRTRKVRLLKRAECIEVKKIRIDERGISGTEELDDEELLEMDGFGGMTMEEFVDFFSRLYGLPYEGYLIVWADTAS